MHTLSLSRFLSPIFRPNSGSLARRLLRSGLPFAAVLTLAAGIGPVRAETVACARADIPAEFAICNSESLQDLDAKLDVAYRKEVALVANTPKLRKFEQEQAGWVRERDACKADMACLAMRYQERLLDLDSGTPEKPTALLGFTND